MEQARKRFKPQITLTVIARELHVSLQAVSQWEKNGKISRDNVLALARFLETTAEWLVDGTGTPPGPVKSEIVEIDLARLDPEDAARLRPFAIRRRKERETA